jgi:hypothetical protein
MRFWNTRVASLDQAAAMRDPADLDGGESKCFSEFRDRHVAAKKAFTI